MGLKYNENFTFDQNVKDLADAKAGQVRDLEDRRARLVSNVQNHPELVAMDVKAIDDKLVHARYHADAAAEGMVYHDPRYPGGFEPEAQTWVARARERGRLVTPDTWGPSVHDLDKTVRIRVIRGGERGVNLGAPASR
jgi:hypothetical protein